VPGGRLDAARNAEAIERERLTFLQQTVRRKRDMGLEHELRSIEEAPRQPRRAEGHRGLATKMVEVSSVRDDRRT
jgi:hypothetical protein